MMLCPSLQCKLFLLGQSNKIASLCCLYCLEGPQSLAADNTTACSTVHDVHHVVLWFVAGVKPVHGSMRQPQPVLAAASYEQQALAKILCKLNWQLATPCGEWGGGGGELVQAVEDSPAGLHMSSGLLQWTAHFHMLHKLLLSCVASFSCKYGNS